MSDSEESYGVIGDTVYADCMHNPEDQVAVSLVGPDEQPAAVLVEACQYVAGEEDVVSLAQVLLMPADARRIAAALLNAADRIDGTVALVFYERPPEDE